MSITQSQATALAQLRDEAAARTAVAAELSDGTITWPEAYPGAGNWTAAYEMAIEDMQRAWRELEAAEKGAER